MVKPYLALHCTRHPDIIHFVSIVFYYLNSRCSDIGKYVMLGSQTRRCVGGTWDGVQPSCLGLNQEKDYASKFSPKKYDDLCGRVAG